MLLLNKMDFKRLIKLRNYVSKSKYLKLILRFKKFIIIPIRVGHDFHFQSITSIWDFIIGNYPHFQVIVKHIFCHHISKFKKKIVIFNLSKNVCMFKIYDSYKDIFCACKIFLHNILLNEFRQCCMQGLATVYVRTRYIFIIYFKV